LDVLFNGDVTDVDTRANALGTALDLQATIASIIALTTAASAIQCNDAKPRAPDASNSIPIPKTRRTTMKIQVLLRRISLLTLPTKKKHRQQA
jgi:hypothetical protein